MILILYININKYLYIFSQSYFSINENDTYCGTEGVHAFRGCLDPGD
jgi:hypothetical protein